MVGEFVIIFYSPVANRYVYLKNRVPSEYLLNYTEDINDAAIFKNKKMR